MIPGTQRGRGSSAKPELKANHTERVISLNEASIVYAGQVKKSNRLFCIREEG